ncbi:unnamed protein product [Notodromas monacha]|uniref:Wnt inhibitory factor 1 n=1 Tax=Notodromas monacha TaxID=399045 RepID=A0A7R9BHE3_9CRUS|nr:unnamed protein product [Notodromas monacha]CAG0915508.1 unnamed protein product [Notodromas monacha]
MLAYVEISRPSYFESKYCLKKIDTIAIDGYEMEIFAIANGQVQPYILDPNFEDYLPVIPSTVGYVNFTWKSGSRKYFYHFELLESSDERILESPIVSVDRKGRVPKKPKTFSVLLPCSGNATGVAGFSIGLNIQTRKGKALPGTPLRLRLRKECTEMAQINTVLEHRFIPMNRFPKNKLLESEKKTVGSFENFPTEIPDLTFLGPDPECDKKCANGGWCNHDKICQCPEGYMGQYCTTALCYPQCMNGGSCTKPGVCSCPPGFHGNHCEGGICQQKCLNNGKCIQKDTCLCPKGFYGSRCEFSKCVIPCLNGGRCRGVNVCRCPWGFRGAHCEIDVPAAHARKQLRQAECRRPCRNGYCVGNNRCKCEPGWYGKLCQRRNPTVRSAPTPELGERPPKRKRVWV